jgi:hypothetical protein
MLEASPWRIGKLYVHAYSLVLCEIKRTLKYSAVSNHERNALAVESGKPTKLNFVYIYPLYPFSLRVTTVLATSILPARNSVDIQECSSIIL